MAALTLVPVSNHKEAEQALSRARIGMMGTKGATFITSVCFSLRQVFTDEIPRAGTDGKVIYYNPDWFLSIEHKERIGIVVHETWHVALNHCKMQLHSRMGKRDPKLWNVATDAIINLYIIDSGLKLPQDKLGYVWMPEMRGMSCEQVYELLLNKVQKQEPIPQLDPDAMDILDPAKTEDGAADNDKGADIDLDMQQILVRAAMLAKMAGDDPGLLPGELQFQLSNITNPKLPWQRLVQRFFSARAKTLYNFVRPNRRYFPKHYLPSRHGFTLKHVMMAIDMSRSVTDGQIEKFVAEVSQCLRTIAPKQLALVEFDTRVTQVTQLTNAQQLVNHTFKGRGGTNITPVIAHANASKTDLLVVFTDGYFVPSRIEPTKPVLWVIYDNPRFRADYGHVIHVEL